MGYNAGEDIEKLEYDFTDFNGPVGCTPEPSQTMVIDWQNAMNQQAIDAQLDGIDLKTASPTEVARAVLAKDRHAMSVDALDAFARLCGAVEVPNPSKAKGAAPTVWKGGAPSRDEIVALPFRAQRGWFGWLTGMMTNPEQRPAATS